MINSGDVSPYFFISLAAIMTVNATFIVLSECGVLSRVTIMNAGIALLVMMFILGKFVLPPSARRYGLNTRKLKLNIVLGLALGILFMIAAVMLRYHLYRSGNHDYGWRFSYFSVLKLIIVYPVSVIAQESIIKGFFQDYLADRFSPARYGLPISIILSSLVFAQFHLVVGFPLFMATFVYSMCTGFIYYHTESVVSISLIHFLGGAGLLTCNGMGL